MKKSYFLHNQEKNNFVPDHSDSSDSENEDLDEHQPNTERHSKKFLQAHSLFQTMLYMVNNGKKKSPIQIMQGHQIYERCKSKELITSSNAFGFSVSYTTLRKLRNNLGARVVHLNSQNLFLFLYNLTLKNFVLLPLITWIIMMLQLYQD